jgi:hypothetical protein
MRKLALVIAIVFTVFSPLSQMEAQAGYKLGWTVVKETPLRSCHASNCRRMVRLVVGDKLTATKYWDNWAYVTLNRADAQQSGWVLISAIDRDIPASTLKRCYDTTFGYTKCAPKWIDEAITHEAKRYKVDRDLMMQIAACESDFRPTTLGAAGEIGIFQWMPSTWYTSNTVGDIHDSWNQSTNAAKFIKDGYAYWWTCWRRIVQGER